MGLGNILGGLLGIAEAPKASTAPVVETEEVKKKARTARSALLETEGGIMGQELQPGQVSRRDTLFNN